MSDKNYELDLSNHRYGTQVKYEEYTDFIEWYMKKSNIRKLKMKDTVSCRTVIDKKTKESVSRTIVSGYGVGYIIYNNFYDIYKEENNYRQLGANKDLA